MKRPLDVTLASLYYAGFASLLIVVLLSQITEIHERWIDAVFPVAFCFLIAFIPAVIALGLWTLDSSARIAAVMFALIHIVTTIAYMAKLPRIAVVPCLRIILDCVVILAMYRPQGRHSPSNQIAFSFISSRFLENAGQSGRPLLDWRNHKSKTATGRTRLRDSGRLERSRPYLNDSYVRFADEWANQPITKPSATPLSAADPTAVNGCRLIW